MEKECKPPLIDSVAGVIRDLAVKSSVCHISVANLIMYGVKTSLLNCDEKSGIQLVLWYLSAFAGKMHQELCSLEDEPCGRKELCAAWKFVFSKKYDAICKVDSLQDVCDILSRTSEQEYYTNEHLDYLTSHRIFD